MALAAGSLWWCLAEWLWWYLQRQQACCLWVEHVKADEGANGERPVVGLQVHHGPDGGAWGQELVLPRGEVHLSVVQHHLAWGTHSHHAHTQPPTNQHAQVHVLCKRK